MNKNSCLLPSRFMMRHICWFALLTILMCLCGCTVSPVPDRPNVVLILADDMGYSDIGAYGGEISTPHLDQLAASGLRFTQFYNAARCCPTRAALLTGLYPHQAGMGRMTSAFDTEPQPGPYQGYLSDRAVTIAEALKAAGYHTYMSGKWHVGERPEHWPRRRGFDRYFGLITGASSYFEVLAGSKKQPRGFMVREDTRWTPPREGFYMTDAITDYAVETLREHASTASGEPFFLYVAYTAPHWPLHALPEDIEKYRGRYHAGWDSLRAERYLRMRDLGIIDERYVLTDRPESIPAWAQLDDTADWEARMEVYAAMVDRMDQGIGRIVKTLDETGAAENTLVLFLSDNGGCAENISARQLNDPAAPVGSRGSYVAYREPWANASNTPFRRYKAWTYEGGIATPFIVHWPGRIPEPGHFETQVGHVVDIMATVLDAAGVDYPRQRDGKQTISLAGESLLPVIEGSGRIGDRLLFWEHIGSRAVRQGRWKLVFDRSTGDWQLFDMEQDPSESTDLSSRYPERAEALEATWKAWADSVGVFELP